MIPETLFDAFSLLRQTDRAISNPNLLNNLKTVFKRYILSEPHLGWRFSEKELKVIEECLAKVTIKNFIQAKPKEILNTHLERAVEAQKIKYVTAKNYRSALKIFLRWMCSQHWYHKAAGTWDGIRAPRLKEGASLAEGAMLKSGV